MLPVRLTMVAVVVAGIGLGAYHNDYLQQNTSTKLEIEISGGFAYIPSPNDRRLHIAYLNSVLVNEGGAVVCDVPQVGTELQVVRGVVDDYDGRDPMPQTRIFNLDKARVTFPKLESATIQLHTPRHGWKPNPLKAPHGDPAWKDLQYVPRIQDHPGMGSRRLKGNWRNDENVNGFMTLRGGRLEGTNPSDPIAEMAALEFRNISGGTTYSTLVSGSDKTIYTVVVPDNEVEIKFAQSSYGHQRLVLKPNASGEAVRLRLRGLHSMNAPPKDGDELKDFCAFHQLLTPAVPASEYVKIFYKAPTPPQGGAGMPSPGFFCVGDWF